MKSGGHGSGIEVINKTKHDLSHADTDALKTNVKKGIKEVKQVIVEETPDSTSKFHDLELKYVTPKGTFLYCKAASGDFSWALSQLKSCKKE